MISSLKAGYIYKCFSMILNPTSPVVTLKTAKLFEANIDQLTEHLNPVNHRLIGM